MKKRISPIWLAKECARLAENKKGRRVAVYDVRRLTPFYDYCVVCSGNSNVQVNGISEAIIQELKKLGILPLHREGLGLAQWILLDYSCVMVHVFKEDTRKYYGLEELWGKAKAVNLKE